MRKQLSVLIKLVDNCRETNLFLYSITTSLMRLVMSDMFIFDFLSLYEQASLLARLL